MTATTWSPCPTCGAPLTFAPGICGQYIMTTLIGYTSPPGHDHNDNCQSREYVCTGPVPHRHFIAVRRRCSVPGCDWVGKKTCFCHPGPKLDHWPEEATL